MRKYCRPVRGVVVATIRWPAIMLGKDDVLDHPSRIKGRKVRVFGKTLGVFVRAAGGAPVLLSGSEQFLAYQRVP